MQGAIEILRKLRYPPPWWIRRSRSPKGPDALNWSEGPRTHALLLLCAEAALVRKPCLAALQSCAGNSQRFRKEAGEKSQSWPGGLSDNRRGLTPHPEARLGYM